MSQRKNINDLDLTTVYRGETPADIYEKCCQLVQQHLGGLWMHITAEQLIVSRISGGFTNQLYYCSLPKNIEPIRSEPKEVAIRFYGAKHFNNLDTDGNERLSDTIIGFIASEKKLGPKVYGLFQNGQIMKYYKHHQFRKAEYDDPKMVTELARKLAQIHSINIPIKKNNNWIFPTFDVFYDKAYKLFPIDEYIEECNYETLKNYDLKAEKQWLKECVEETNSPVVFCHNDFRGSNVMVIDDENHNCEQNIIICDFEYSSYSYRGVDFGTIAAEWGFADINDFKKDWQYFPDDSVLTVFIDEYINECAKIHGPQYKNDNNNSVKQLLKEFKVFTLVAKMLFILIGLQMNETFGDIKPDKKSDLNYIDGLYKNYQWYKNKFIREGIIQKTY